MCPSCDPSVSEGVKKLNLSPALSGVKTGVQSVRNASKTLDSGWSSPRT